MFNQDAIKALATHINSRAFAPHLTALGVLSKLIMRKAHGSNVVYQSEVGALLHTNFENAFPLPYMNLTVDGKKNTVTLNHHTFVVPEGEENVQLMWNYPSNPFSIVIKNEEGQYLMIASGDRYAIPHGEYGVPFDMAAHRAFTGAMQTDNLVVSASQAVWIIEDWKDFGVVFSANGFDFPRSSFQRIHNHHMSCSPLELDTEETLKTVHLAQDLTDALGLEKQPYPYSVQDLVENLLEVTNEVEDLRRRVPKNVDTDTDAATLDIALKIQNSIHFKELLAEVMELPAKKRTKKALEQIIPRHLQRRIDEWAKK